MSILRDKEIVALILNSTSPLLTGHTTPSDWYSKDSLVQPSSLDLHVGEIYVPPKKEPKVNDPADKRRVYNLLPGQAIIIETLEKLNLPSDIAGFGFPPTSISDRAILMTNPGHIDPGFNGKLSFTLINMGREAFNIERGKSIVTILLDKLETVCEKDFAARHPASAATDPYMLTPQGLFSLGRDFLDLGQRTASAAEDAVRKANHRITLLQIFVPIAGIILTGVAIYFQSKNATNELKQKIDAIENQIKFESRVKEVETKVENLKDSINVKSKTGVLKVQPH